MSNEELVTRIKAGVDTADNMLQLWQQNQGMIHLIAKRYQGFEPLEDLEQEGYIGLCKAVEHYDHCAGATFISYAAYWIKQTIYRYLEENGRIVRIPNHAQTAMQKYNRFCNDFLQQFNRKPSRAEIARHMGISSDRVEQLQKDICMASIGSLDAALPLEADNLTVGDTVASTEELEAEAVERESARQIKEALWDVVDSLDPDCAAVIRYRFIDNLTLQDTGEAMGTTTAAARKRQAKGIRQLRSSREMHQLGREYGYIQSHAYRDSGLSKFRNTWTSSTEYTALKLMEL